MMNLVTEFAFAGSRIDRADHIRADPDALSALMTLRARLLLLDGLDPVIAPEGALSWGTLAEAHPEAELVFLGLDRNDGDRACFAQVAPDLVASMGPANPRMWAAMMALGDSDLATYGGARSLVSWHARHRFCAVCGAPTRLAKGGWQRSCSDAECRSEHFPRVDPVTIMLVECEGDLLLGRQPRFPAGNFSALAGFVEPGESIEEAVAREVLEEAGVRARDVRYVASQPWPFPSSLMIGCHSVTDDRNIVIDETELDDARWFSRAEVADALDAVDRGEPGSAFRAPPRYAIANYLMRWWTARG